MEMIEMLFAVSAITIILLILWYALPFLIAVAVISVTIYLVKRFYANNLASIREAAENDRQIVDRADRQHQSILDGDEDNGTYGRYPPAM